MRRLLITVLCMMVLLTGCGREDPYRVDTVIRIPVNPTEATEIPVTVLPETEPAADTVPVPETESPTEETTEETTEPTEAPEKSDGGSGGDRPSSNKEDSGKDNPILPPQTEPAATETEPEETAPRLYDISGYSPGSLEYSVVDTINAAREEAGLPALECSDRLCAIASCRAYELSRLWSHDRPDGRGYATVLTDYGYSAGTVTELLVNFTGSGEGNAIADKWLGSQSGRERILDGNYVAVGVGVYRSGGYIFVCGLLVG